MDIAYATEQVLSYPPILHTFTCLIVDRNLFAADIACFCLLACLASLHFGDYKDHRVGVVMINVLFTSSESNLEKSWGKSDNYLLAITPLHA